MSELTKEPWRIPEDRQLEIEGEYGDAVARVHADGGTHDFHDARRIVACVNACAGIDTDFLERTHAEGYESGFRKHIECEKQRDKLLAALKEMTPVFNTCRIIMNSQEARDEAGEIVAKARAIISEVEAQS